MSNELKFNIAADSSKAVAAFQKVGDSAKDAKKELKEFTGASSTSPAKQWQEADKAVTSYARQLDKASKRTERLAKSTSKWRGALAKGLKWGGAAIAAGVTAAGVVGVQKAAEREANVGRLAGSLGSSESARGVASELTSWSAKNGADVDELLKHTDRLVKAGMTAGQAVAAVQSAVIAAAGDASKVDGILEPLTEFMTKGFIEEEILDKFAELGVDLRAGLQETLGISREELDSAVSSYSITAEAALAAMRKLTAEGTKLHDSHKLALSGMAGTMKTISAQFDELSVSFGSGIGGGMKASLDAAGRDMENAMSEFSTIIEGVGASIGFVLGSLVVAIRDAVFGLVKSVDWIAEQFGGDVVSDNFGKNVTPHKKMGNWEAYQGTAEQQAEQQAIYRRKASAKVAAERLAARDSAAAAEIEANISTLLGSDHSSPEAASILKRHAKAQKLDAALAAIAAFGLDENSTAEDIDLAAMSAENAGMGGEFTDALAKMHALGGAQGGSFRQIADRVRRDSAISLDESRSALAANQALADQQALEAEAAAAQKIREEFERRMAIQDAILAGDEKRAELLQQQAEAEKLAADYAAKGIELETARAMAAEEVAKRSAKPQAADPYDPLAQNVRLRETISSPLANIGGGGVRIRLYENQQLTAATKTATNTSTIAEVTAQILSHLQSSNNIAVLG